MLTPLHRWGSREIADWIRRAPKTGRLPEPGHHAMPLRQETTMLLHTTSGPTDWTDTAPCNHRRDAAMPPGRPAVTLADLTPNQRRILRLLADLDMRPLPHGTRLRMCVNRRRIRASAEAMQELHRMGLVNGAGSRDAWGTGNTPASSWWWLSTAGLEVLGAVGLDGAA